MLSAAARSTMSGNKLKMLIKHQQSYSWALAALAEALSFGHLPCVSAFRERNVGEEFESCYNYLRNE